MSLFDHWIGLASDIGLTIREMIDQEVVFQIPSNTEETRQLYRLVSELSTWLCDRGVCSGLWCEKLVEGL